MTTLACCCYVGSGPQRRGRLGGGGKKMHSQEWLYHEAGVQKCTARSGCATNYQKLSRPAFLRGGADMLISRFRLEARAEWIAPKYWSRTACSKRRRRSSANTLRCNTGAIQNARHGLKSCGAWRTRTA